MWSKHKPDRVMYSIVRANYPYVVPGEGYGEIRFHLLYGDDFSVEKLVQGGNNFLAQRFCGFLDIMSLDRIYDVTHGVGAVA